MAKKFIFSLVLMLILAPVILPVSVSAATAKKVVAKTVVKKKVPVLTTKDLLGRLVLQSQSENKLWYVDPVNKLRYYLHNDADLQLVADNLGVKPTVKDFAKLAQNKKTKTPATLIKKYSGRIIINPSHTSTPYYFNPADNIIYMMDDFADFYKTGKVIGIGATDSLLRQLPMNSLQLTYDPVFYGTAQVQYDGQGYSYGKESKRILSLASVSKIMTALVFFDTNPDWEKVVEITPAEIRYPCTLQTCGSTSEINLKTGDKLKIKDLWVAMLTASSNQSAKILADNSGLTTEEFVAKMNEKAKSLGLVKTQFVEMSGLSADNISTAEEFSKVVELAFSNEIIAAGTRHTSYVFTVEQADGTPRDVSVVNRNYSLLAFNPIASKSGYLVEAQRNAVIMKEGKVIIVFHAYSLDQRNSIVKKILDGNELASAQ